MPIPESQLLVWSNLGATASAVSTHQSIRHALETSTKLADVRYEAYLQGSYRNTTNIRGDSDVDLVVQLTSAFQPNTSSLSAQDLQFYKSAMSDATYGWTQFRSDVLQALRVYYGTYQVEEGKKTIKVKAGSGRLQADVVVCIEHRKYMNYRPGQTEDYIEGMTFYVPSENRWVINYPKLHYDNGTKKNDRTNMQYKPVVRMFKNARSYMVERLMIPAGLSPSYFLECLLYNVPNTMYERSFQGSYCNIVNWLLKADLQTFLCQNEQLSLFGLEPEQWSISSARQLNHAFINLWNNWH